MDNLKRNKKLKRNCFLIKMNIYTYTAGTWKSQKETKVSATTRKSEKNNSRYKYNFKDVSKYEKRESGNILKHFN